MKKISYYELLSTEASDEIKNIPTSALKFSRNTAQVFFKDTTVIDGKIHQKFPKIGDLLAYGKTPLMGLFVGRVKTYQELDDVILEVEEKLAKLGLKFKDSEFTVGDVRVKNLNLCPTGKKLLSTYSNKIKTLDDLSTFGATKISNFTSDNGYEVIIDISKALEKYGLKLENSPYRISQERFFPLDEFDTYINSESKRKVKKQEKEKNVNVYTQEARQALASLSPEELLTTSIDKLPLSIRIKQTFDRLNIKTIGELINTNQNYIKNELTHDQFITVEDVLASHDLKFYNSNREIRNGKVIRTRPSRTTQKAPKPQDITKLSKEEQERFLSTPILEFGLAPYLEDAFKNQTTYLTIRDLIASTRQNLSVVIDNPSVAQSVSKLLKSYGLEMKPSEATLAVTKYVNEIQIYKNNLPQNPTEEEKQSYLEMPLEKAGFTDKLIEVIHNAGFPAKTIGDVISHKRNEYFGNGITDAQIRAMRVVLLNYGFTIYSDENNWRNKTPLQEDTSIKENYYELRKQKHKKLVDDYLKKRATKSNINLSDEDKSEQ